MTQEEKQLLLKDLCSRFPYGVKASYYGAEEECETWDEIEGITFDGYVDIGQYSLPIESVKPYLYPLSSMTEEQTEELLKLINIGQNDNNEFMRSLCRIEFYHKNHFDYRGLIGKELALDASKLNIY